jgi:hypothetical protein
MSEKYSWYLETDYGHGEPFGTLPGRQHFREKG